MNFISLFAGVGGFDLALERAGHKCVYANEWDKYCKIIYDKHFKIKLDGRSITDVTTDEIPDHGLLVGGFPCQAFSIAGKRGGFSDTRGTMFFEIARILQAKKPRLFILENVKGLLSHDNGATFKTIITTLTELGYDCQWQVLNSKNFGVPQNRERVFIIGNLRGTSRPEVFPIGESNGATVKKLGNKNPSGHGQSGQVVSTEGLHPTLGAGGGNPNRKRDIGWSSGYIQQLNNPTHSNDRVYGAEGISPAFNTMQGGMRQPKIMNTNINGHTFEHEYAGTLRAGASSNYQTVNAIRRLTPLECERLQGFPDGWTKGVSDTQRYKMMGNAVTVSVVEYLLQNIS